MPDAEERFWRRVKRGTPSECWEWLGAKLHRGHGIFHYTLIPGQHQQTTAHRFAYERLVGAIPEGLQLDHLCRNPGCVNPAHLEPVTGRENVLRGVGPTAINARKTHCIHGHEFTPENTYRSKKGGRECRACLSIRQAAYYRRKG
jgi:hypothetical protein